MNRLLETYRAVCRQAFIPIFATDDHDPRVLLEGCLEAGARVVEFTLRRTDAAEMIPWIRRAYPDLILLVGSTVGETEIVERARPRHPQLLTLDELAAIGVDGFVTMVGFPTETIRRFAATHLMVPASMTLREAFAQSAAGAHFTKLLGPDLSLCRLCAGPATYGFSPVFITGGIHADRLPDTFAAGAVVVGAGLEVVLGQRSSPPSTADVAAGVTRYLELAQRLQHERWPTLARAESMDTLAWLKELPFNHPF